MAYPGIERVGGTKHTHQLRHQFNRNRIRMHIISTDIACELEN